MVRVCVFFQWLINTPGCTIVFILQIIVYCASVGRRASRKERKVERPDGQFLLKRLNVHLERHNIALTLIFLNLCFQVIINAI